MAKAFRRAQAQLALRRAAHDRVDKAGTNRPGSMNPRKSQGRDRKGKY